MASRSAGKSLQNFKWTFADVHTFCKESNTKHEAKGYKYFCEQYLHNITGTLYASLV